MNEGFIFLSRTILEHQIFASEKLLKIWLWCLCKANFKTKFIPLKIGKGTITVEVKRGQFIFGRNKAEEELFIDGSTVYKCMQKLEQFESISIESNNQYSIITICNYDTYNTASNYIVTTNEQPSNNLVTTNEQPSNTTKNDNKDNNDNKKEIYISEIEKLKKEIESLKEKKENRDTFKVPVIEEIKIYFKEIGLNGRADKEGQKFFDFYSSKNWFVGKNKMKDWKAACRNWKNNIDNFNKNQQSETHKMVR